MDEIKPNLEKNMNFLKIVLAFLSEYGIIYKESFFEQITEAKGLFLDIKQQKLCFIFGAFCP